MTRLKDHGKHVKLKQCLKQYAFCEDGTIFKDTGEGFKKYGKLKEGLNYIDIKNKWEKKYLNKLVKLPSTKAFYDALDEYFFSIQDKNNMLSLISLMPDDADGVWSTLDDYSYCSEFDLMIDDVVNLCQLYKDHQKELKIHNSN